MARNHSDDVVRVALGVLDDHGLADLTMRRLGAELGVRASALYHHFPSKQVLLAAVADAVLAHGPRRPRPPAWDEAVVAVCADLRDALLSHRDGAELVAAVRGMGLGARGPEQELALLLTGAGLDAAASDVGARTLAHLVLGHTLDEQTLLQAGSAGAVDAVPDDRAGARFAAGLDLVVEGLRVRLAAPLDALPAGGPAGGADPGRDAARFG